VTELEELAIVWELCHFRAYLLGHKCIMYTYHSPLKEYWLLFTLVEGIPGGVKHWQSLTWRFVITLDVQIVMHMGSQRDDPELTACICFMETGAVPHDAEFNFGLVQFYITGRSSLKQLCLVFPKSLRHTILQESHFGQCWGNALLM